MQSYKIKKLCRLVWLVYTVCTLTWASGENCKQHLTFIGALSRIPDLSKEQPLTWVNHLVQGGYSFHSYTKGGYARFRHLDGSQIWIRDNGEVVRLAPKVTPAQGGKKYHPRIDSMGERAESHNTGEFVIPVMPR